MRFILTGKCICGAPFNKNTEMKDIVLNEENLVQFRCDICKSFFNISTLWKKYVEPRTIAQTIHGKDADGTSIKGRVIFDRETSIHTFEDGSQAKLITRFEECDPFLSATVTVSKKEVRYWKALV